MTTPATTTRQPIIVYHAADLDGKCSAAIALRALRRADAECQPLLIPMDYGWAPPAPGAIPDGSVVYILDFSFEPDYMLQLTERCNVIWIDHHTPRIRELEAAGIPARCLDHSLADHDPAACLLTWRLFYGADPVPDAVVHINAWDATPDPYRCGPEWDAITRPAQFGLRLRLQTPQDTRWHPLLGDPDPSVQRPPGVSPALWRLMALDLTMCVIINDGKAICTYLDDQNKRTIPRQAYALQLHLPPIVASDAEPYTGPLKPMRALVLNRLGTDPKDLLHHPDCADPSKAPDVLVTYGYEGHAALWRLSLSPGPNSPTLDCGRISASAFSGGGHPGRAGAAFAKPPCFLFPSPAGGAVPQE